MKHQFDPPGYVINLSNFPFSIDTYKLLNKNLNFNPTKSKYNKNQLDQDLQKFYRIIKLKAFFKDTDNNYEKDEHDIFKINTKKWTPSENHHTINTFIDLVEYDVNEATQEETKNYRPNLTKGEKEAMKELSKREDIIITNADKGGAVVIMDINKYILECNRQLNDSNTYKKLSLDPTDTHVNLINDIIHRFKIEKLIPEKIANGLITTDQRTPKFYILPKIHKEGNPGRPVVSSINCHSTKISRYVIYHLQPLLKQIPSYIKDSTDFINRIKGLKIPKQSLLVTLDVKSLYTNIPNYEGIKTTRELHEKYQNKTVPTKVITTFLGLILSLNNFNFNSNTYLQTKGCAIRTKLCQYFYGTFRRKIHLSNYKRKNNTLFEIY